jgi:Zn-dependent protease with chaperone function
VFHAAAAATVPAAETAHRLAPEAVARRPATGARALSPIDLDTLYPPAPEDVPSDLTIPGPRYRLRVVLVLLSLMLFFALYLGLLVGSGCLIVLALRYLCVCGLPISLCSLIVFLYLLKGFFKTEQERKSLRVEVTNEEQPRLFAFIRRVCAEVGAPAPRRVFLDPEVNAAAFYERSILGLVRPAPKNLLLGLGLVNVLTLSEFKALLAHEFGHFSQSSMKLGEYVYVANRVLRELVVGRDWLDDMLLRWRSPRNVLGLIGWACWGIVYGMRKTMEGSFYGINFLSLSLSREMEFHADLVAVGVAGSEAVVRTLARTEFAALTLERAKSYLRVAADHRLYSTDLFAHHRDAIDDLRRERNDPHLGEPVTQSDDPMLAVEAFDPEGDKTSIWSSHPSEYDREQNIKRRYVRCLLDNRPAWLLFDNAQEACARVTWRFYRVVLKVPRDTALEDPEVVRTFLDEERRAVTYNSRYHGMYDERFIAPGYPAELSALGGDDAPAQDVLRRRHASLYARNLPGWASDFERHLKEKYRILAFRQEGGRGKEKELEFRNRRYGLDDVKRLLKLVEQELEKDRRRLADVDREVFLVHYQMSRQLGPTASRALRQRYDFHLAQQRIFSNLLGQQTRLESALAYVAGRRDGPLPGQLFQELFALLRDVRAALAANLEAADRLRLPPLWHMKPGEPLGPFLYDRRLAGQFRWSARSISGKKIGKLHEQLSEVIWRARRIHFKSLGGILSLQEEIARQWLDRFGGGRAGSTATVTNEGG